MIEIYLFVNPLGGMCLNVEKDILKFVETENKKIQFRFIPLVNMKTINDVIHSSDEKYCGINQRNQLFEDVYSAALDYKAGQLQGKKKGRHLLLGIQKAVTIENKPYSPNLAEQLIIEVGGDLEMFKADRNSDFVKKSFQTDQQIAREMGIVKHPSAVIYNYTCDRDFGVLVENCNSMDEIKRLCESSEETKHYLHETFDSTHRNESRAPHGHLHLL